MNAPKYITERAREFSVEDIPEMKLLGKFLNGGQLTEEDRDYMRTAEQVSPGFVDDNRSQDQARADYLRSLNDDETAQLITDCIDGNEHTIADYIISGDAIALLGLFERVIDRDVP